MLGVMNSMAAMAGDGAFDTAPKSLWGK